MRFQLQTMSLGEFPIVGAKALKTYNDRDSAGSKQLSAIITKLCQSWVPVKTADWLTQPDMVSFRLADN